MVASDSENPEIRPVWLMGASYRRALPHPKRYRKVGRQSRGRMHQQDGKTGVAGDDPRPLPRVLQGHAKSAIISVEYGGVSRFLVQHGYGPDGKNPKREMDKWRSDGKRGCRAR